MPNQSRGSSCLAGRVRSPKYRGTIAIRLAPALTLVLTLTTSFSVGTLNPTNQADPQPHATDHSSRHDRSNDEFLSVLPDDDDLVLDIGPGANPPERGSIIRISGEIYLILNGWARKMDEERQKVTAYLDVIREHVIRPVAETGLGKSCTASILLLFAAIDGLGKLTHPKDKTWTKNRFRHYVCTYMPSKYARCCEDLYDLRKSLAHNAINFTSFMSHAEMGESHHLQYHTVLGYLFVSSTVLLRDFENSLIQLEKDVDHDTGLRARAAKRLKWLEDDVYSDWGEFSTPPIPVQFISLG